MRNLELVTFAVLVGVSAAVPIESSGDHLNEFQKRSDTFKHFGRCTLNRPAKIPAFPDQAFVLAIEEVTPNEVIAPASMLQAYRRGFFGGAGNPTATNAFFPHWYHDITWDGTATGAPPSVARIPSNNPLVRNNDSFANIDHVFEIFTFRLYLGAQAGLGDITDPTNFNDDARVQAECIHFNANVNKRPKYYPAPTSARQRLTLVDDNPQNGFIQSVIKHLPGFDRQFPGRYAAGEFIGVEQDLNRYKGRVFEANMQFHFDATETGARAADWAKGVTADDLVARMIDIERLSNVFEFMNEPAVAPIYKRTANRLTRVFKGVDAYLARGNKDSFTAADAPFTMSDGITQYQFATPFRAWLQSFLTLVTNRARTFITARINELENDLADPATTAANKNAVRARLQAFKAAGRHRNAHLTFPIAAMLPDAVTAGTPTTAIYRIGAATETEPHRFFPFTTRAPAA